jgi:hypothetical protein
MYFPNMLTEVREPGKPLPIIIVAARNRAIAPKTFVNCPDMESQGFHSRKSSAPPVFTARMFARVSNTLVLRSNVMR